MKFYLALFVVLTGFGIPAVATYFPTQTYNVMSFFESSPAKTAALIDSFKSMAAGNNSAAAVTVTPQPVQRDIPDHSIWPPQPI